MLDRFRQVVILGADGQLGGEFRHRLPIAIPLNRVKADITSEQALRTTLNHLAPDLVLNCAAYNNVDEAEIEPEAAFAVNALGARNVARVCKDLEATLVHVSTDAVFGKDQSRREPYTETALSGPVNVYGTSKLAGEHLVTAVCPECLVVRTCGLYGYRRQQRKPGSFVDRILAKAKAGEHLRVVNDQHCTPSSAEDVAEGILALLDAEVRGLVHLTNQGCCTWYEFAWAALDIAGVSASLTPIAGSHWHALATRPDYSVLANEVYGRSGLPPLPDWREALRRYLLALG